MAFDDGKLTSSARGMSGVVTKFGAEFSKDYGSTLRMHRVSGGVVCGLIRILRLYEAMEMTEILREFFGLRPTYSSSSFTILIQYRGRFFLVESMVSLRERSGLRRRPEYEPSTPARE